MRKWHRWLSVFFAIVMIWVAVTGLLHYVVVWWPSAEPSAAAGFVCPEGWRCIAPRPDTGNPLAQYLGLFHHLHAGSEGGIWGEIIVMLSGLALVFFTVSGMWMYFQMWTVRKAKGLKQRVFWK